MNAIICGVKVETWGSIGCELAIMKGRN